MTPEHGVLIERIRSSATVVRRAVETAPPARFHQGPLKAREWSALETLTHLRDVIVFVYGLRMRRLFYETAPVFADFDEEGYAAPASRGARRPEPSWTRSSPSTSSLARLLQTLPDADWSREGRHPSFGVMSIEFLARRVGEHAEEHAAQIVGRGAAPLSRTSSSERDVSAETWLTSSRQDWPGCKGTDDRRAD